MFTVDQLLAFTLAAVLITASPGPDNLMVLSMGIAKGRLQGIAFGLGCALGCLSHTLLAVLGVGALVAASPWAFTALKWVGGLYLIGLGWKALRHAGPIAAGAAGAAGPAGSADETAAAAAPLEAAAGSAPPASGPGGSVSASSSAPASAQPLWRVFGQGLIANAINPKVVLFFLSFLPQFVVPAQGSVPLQLGVLGLIFTAQAALLFGLLGYFSGSVGAWLGRRPQAGAWLDRLAGVVFVGLGLRLVAGR